MKKLVVVVAFLSMGLMLGCDDDVESTSYTCEGDLLTGAGGEEIANCADDGQVCCCTCPDIETDCHCH